MLLITSNSVIFSKSFPYDATWIPVSTTSLYPFLTRDFTSAIISSNALLLTGPLVYGIIQYVQNLSQPSCILRNALVLPYVSSIESASKFALEMIRAQLNANDFLKMNQNCSMNI